MIYNAFGSPSNLYFVPHFARFFIPASIFLIGILFSSFYNPPFFEKQGKKTNTQEHNVLLISKILGKTLILKGNWAKCKELFSRRE